jgi:hypothetical protein
MLFVALASLSLLVFSESEVPLRPSTQERYATAATFEQDMIDLERRLSAMLATQQMLTDQIESLRRANHRPLRDLLDPGCGLK